MSKSALVVDNDFFFVEFLTEFLEKRGYEVIKAYDGKEAITKFNWDGNSFHYNDTSSYQI
jgi:CheY-like chemotaxis protein